MSKGTGESTGKIYLKTRDGRIRGLDPDDVYPEDVKNGKVSGGKGKWTLWFRKADGIQVCGCWLPHTGKTRRCGVRHPPAPNGRCRLHGGDAVGDRIKHGRRATMRGPLAEAFNRAEEDDHLLDLRPGIALVEMRMEELSQRLEDGDSPAWRLELGALFKEYKKAQRDDDEPLAHDYLQRIENLIAQGAIKDRQWEDLLKVNERRAARAEKAVEMALKSEALLRPQQVQAFMYRVIDVLHEEIPEATALRIASRIVEEVLDGRLSRIRKPKGAEATDKVLSGLQGERAGVRPGGAWREAVGVPEDADYSVVPERKALSADKPRAGEDKGGGDGSASVPEHPEGRGSDHDGADGSPGQEPTVG